MMMNMTTRATRMPIMAGSTWGPTPPAMGGRIGEGEEGGTGGREEEGGRRREEEEGEDVCNGD